MEYFAIYQVCPTLCNCISYSLIATYIDLSPKLIPGDQQDAHEFLRFLFEELINNVFYEKHNYWVMELESSLPKIFKEYLEKFESEVIEMDHAQVIEYIQENMRKLKERISKLSDCNVNTKTMHKLCDELIDIQHYMLLDVDVMVKEHKNHFKDLKVQFDYTISNLKETTVINAIWGGTLLSKIRCLKCKCESDKFDSMTDISLEIHGSSVKTAMKHFCKVEVLYDEYNCDKCNETTDIVKQLTIYLPPKILIIQLKRFTTVGPFRIASKIDDFVSFEENMDIGDFMSYSAESNVSYSLFGIVVHSGKNKNSGHYVAYIKGTDGNWYYFSDSDRKGVEIEKVLKQKAYLLFYQTKMKTNTERIKSRFEDSESE